MKPFRNGVTCEISTCAISLLNCVAHDPEPKAQELGLLAALDQEGQPGVGRVLLGHALEEVGNADGAHVILTCGASHTRDVHSIAVLGCR